MEDLAESTAQLPDDPSAHRARIEGPAQTGSEQTTTTEERQAIKWLLARNREPRTLAAGGGEPYAPPSGDLTKLNSARLVLDSVGHDALRALANESVGSLGTSGAICEANGDHVLGLLERVSGRHASGDLSKPPDAL